MLNGKQAAYASGVTLILYYNGSVYIENGAAWWFVWSGSGWTRISADPRGSSAVTGVCGSSNGQSLSSAPTSNLCSTGAASAVGGSGPWNWSCAGSNGGSTASCSALLKATTVNGACGSTSGAVTSVAPTSGLCAAGTASVVSGNGPWSWSCAGSNGGTNASCSAAPPQTTGNLLYGVNLSGAEWGSNFPGTYGIDYYYPTASELEYYHGKGLTLSASPFRGNACSRFLMLP